MQHCPFLHTCGPDKTQVSIWRLSVTPQGCTVAVPRSSWLGFVRKALCGQEPHLIFHQWHCEAGKHNLHFIQEVTEPQSQWRRDSIFIFHILQFFSHHRRCPVEQRSPTYLVTGTGFMEDSFSTDGVWVEWVQEQPRSLAQAVYNTVCIPVRI